MQDINVCIRKSGEQVEFRLREQEEKNTWISHWRIDDSDVSSSFSHTPLLKNTVNMIRIRIGWFCLSQGAVQFYKCPSSATKEPGSSLCFLMFKCTTQPAFSARWLLQCRETPLTMDSISLSHHALALDVTLGKISWQNEMVKPKNSITERRETDNNRTKMRPLSKTFDSTGCQHFYDIIYQTVKTIVGSKNNRLLSNTCFCCFLWKMPIANV